MKSLLLSFLGVALCTTPAMARAADLSGEWAFEVSTSQGSEFTVTYDGEIEGDDAVRGTVDLAGTASGTFTGRRKKT
jgi:hypothetical protein